MTFEDRKAVAPHSTATSDGAWDGPANERRLREDEDPSYYASAHAWRDPDEDGTAKNHWSFIHHEVSANGDVGAANLTACSTGIGVLNGGRIGRRRPKWWADRASIHRHFARHLEDAEKEVPALRVLTLDIERRDLEPQLAEVRVVREEGKPAHIVGHAAVFDRLSLPIGFGGFREEVAPGTFKKTLRDGDIRSLFNHNPDYILGRNRAGTATFREDETGLYFDAEPPPEAPWTAGLIASIERGDVTGGSFSFQTIKDRWRTEGGEGFGETIRTLLEARLIDAGPVTFPAYPDTDVNVRSLVQMVGLDWTAIAGAVLRADAGLELAAEQRDIITATIESLQQLLSREPRQAPHSIETARPDEVQADLLKRELELIELEA